MLITVEERGRDGSVAEQTLCMYKALGSILNTKNRKQEDRNEYFAKLKLRSDSITHQYTTAGDCLLPVWQVPQTRT